MKMKARAAISCIAGALAAAACMESSRIPVQASLGADPQLPEPNKTLIPTVHIAPAKGWPDGAKPTVMAGMRVAPFAKGLQHPRWVHVLPNGDVLVAETNAPERPAEGKGLKGRVMTIVMKRAGAGVPSADRITDRKSVV